jgi:hypothetical protein
MKRLLRLWGIRHLRAIYMDITVHRWAADLGRMGLGTGRPHPSDIEHIERVWKGEA